MSTLKVGTIQNADGTRTKYTASAWVNFSGANTPTIRGSKNVSGITDVGSGEFNINFETAMADNNYTCVSTGGVVETTAGQIFQIHNCGTNLTEKTTTYARYQTRTVDNDAPSMGTTDSESCYAAFFGGDE